MAVGTHAATRPAAASVVERLLQPYYVFRPGQLLRCGRDKCLSAVAGKPVTAERVVRLPWGLDIAVNPRESIGHTIVRNGLFDLNVSEALSRLLAPGETGVDVGTNIGHMTSVMAHAVGGDGHVMAFEPHPEVYSELAANVARWRAVRGVGSIELREVALSDRDGYGNLTVHPQTFERNRGSASLATKEAVEDGFTADEVTMSRLDDTLAGPIHVMKIDVEGHELQVLRGAQGLLERGLVRDVIFEEHEGYPTGVTELLEDAGFTLFGLDRTLFGPTTWLPRDWRPSAGEDPSFIASIQPERVKARLARRGWQVFS